MRITQGMMARQFLANYERSMQRLDRYQAQLETGKKITRPSEDPVTAVMTVRAQAELRGIAQFERNASTLLSWVQTTDAALFEAQDLMKTLREKMVQASSDTLGETAMKALAAEIRQIKEQFGAIANTSIGGRYVFGGTNTLDPPYVEGAFQETSDNGPATGNDPGSGKYGGNDAVIDVALKPGIDLPLNVIGKTLFNTQDKDGRTFFAFLDQVADQLEQGRPVGDLLGALDEHEDRFLTTHTTLGAVEGRLELMLSRLSSEAGITEELLSRQSDVDIAEIVTRLSMQENVHRAALATGARILMPTLMDFLR
ncbi:MAG: Flagellar hook-associated protein FlgL [Candidatus Carbobacillus altaicus]|uniref:Flagellar hook-associated protein FlgL n=1 Tax=Candidatus Carbonibacillus altaicus TaxID=2163959 RepID=A0A2R6Y3D7_9BACL|nr:MAG: Flagellar hook-associated protein FlgL [Candidatus Carbobacillus altaicus]